MVQSLWKTVWKFFKKLKTELSYGPAIPLLGIHLKECKVGSQRDICIPMFIAALFTIAQRWKQPKCALTDEWRIKCGLYRQWTILFSLKKEGNSDTCCNMDEP